MNIEYPSALSTPAQNKIEAATKAVSNITMEDRDYDSPSNVDGYDNDNQPYEVVGETQMFDDADVSIHGTDAVVTYHFDGPRGHWFDEKSFAPSVYERMAVGGLAPPTDDPSVGVQVRGNDVFVQNILYDATE